MSMRMLIKLPGRLNIPVMIPITASIIVMVRAHDLPDHRPHVMMNPSIASMNNTTPITVRNTVVMSIIGKPVKASVIS